MTLPRRLARMTEYLLNIEELFYSASNNFELTNEEKKTREELHKDAKEFLNTFKIKCLEDILKEEGEL